MAKRYDLDQDDRRMITAMISALKSGRVSMRHKYDPIALTSFLRAAFSLFFRQLLTPVYGTEHYTVIYCLLYTFLSELPEHAITLLMLRQTLNVRTNNHACSSFLDNHNEPGKNATLGTFTPQAFCNFRHNIT